MIGQRLGQYEIIALIGKGGMSTVYRARQISINRDVAIKVIRPDLLETGEFLERFRREAQIVASLSHPFVLKVFDYGEHNDLVYLVTEFVSAGSLAEMIRKQPLPLDRAIAIIDQVASALDYAHQRGIIHRDLKPHNVLIDTQGNALLTDFGVAKILSETTSLTQSGTAMGTPSYMSPEQWQGKPLDSRTDVYALGIMAFEMLSGTLPFKADTPFSMMHMHINEAPLSLRAFRADIPPSIEKVINIAIAKNPDERYNSANLFANAFKAAAAQASSSKPKLVVAGSEDQTVQAPIPSKAERANAATTAFNARKASPVRLGMIFGALAAVLVITTIIIAVGAFSGRRDTTLTPTSLAVVETSTTAATENAAPTNTVIVAALPTTSVPDPATATSLPAPTTEVPPTVAPTLTTVPTLTAVPPTLTLIPSNTSIPPTDTAAPSPTIELLVSNLSGWFLAGNKGEWEITDDGLQGQITGRNDSIYLAEQTGTDFMFEADFMITGGSTFSSAGLVFRSAEDPSDGSYVVRVSTAGGGQINFFKFYGGKKSPKFTQFYYRKTPIEKNTMYHIQVYVIGDTVAVFLDGTQMFESKDPTNSFTSGHFGLNIHDAAVTFQNVQYETNGQQ